MNSEDVFSTGGLPPREQVASWFKIKDKVGTKISGIFVGWWISPPNKNVDKEQIGVAIKIDDGTVVGVSLSSTSYMQERLKEALPGDKVGIKYEGDKDVGKPQPAKIVKFYNLDGETRRKEGNVKITNPISIGGGESVGNDEEAF